MTTQTTTAVMPKTDREVRILADASAIAQTAAAEFVEAAKEAVCLKDSFSVALSGGSTPKVLYGLLLNNGPLQAIVPWSKFPVVGRRLAAFRPRAPGYGSRRSYGLPLSWNKGPEGTTAPSRQ